MTTASEDPDLDPRPPAGVAQVPAPPPPPVAALGGQLHPAAIALAPLRQIAPLLVLLVTGSFLPVVAGLAVAFSIGASVLRWARFTWHVADGALVIEQGLFARQRRVIPLERIQTVDLVRPLRHRLFGVVEVRVEAIGGSETEGRLDALSPDVADALRAVLLRQPVRPASTVQPAGEALARLGVRDLVLAGLTGGRIGVAAAIVGLAHQLFGDRFFETFSIDLARRIDIDIGGTALLVVAALLAVFVVSIIATALTYWDFTLTHRDDALLVRRGLLEQRFDTVPLRRIQGVTVEENALRRALGMATVKVQIAGRAGGEEAKRTNLLLPIGSRRQAFALVEEALGVAGLAAAPLTPMPHRARRRRITRAVVFTAVVTVPAVIGFGRPGLLALLAFGPALAAALAAYRALGHGQHGGVVLARSGALVRATSFVPVTRLASLALSASPFQRRTGLATLALQIPAASASGTPQLHDLDRGDGLELLLALSEATTVTLLPAHGAGDDA